MKQVLVHLLNHYVGVLPSLLSKSFKQSSSNKKCIIQLSLWVRAIEKKDLGKTVRKNGVMIPDFNPLFMRLWLEINTVHEDE